MPTTIPAASYIQVSDTLTLILSVVAIALAVSAILFEVLFFLVQRHEARQLTKSVQDLVAQAVREEKGIDHVIGSMMPLIQDAVRGRVSDAGARAGTEVRQFVGESLRPLQDGLAEMERASASGAQTLKAEFDAKIEELRKQIPEIARKAGETASSAVAGPFLPGIYYLGRGTVGPVLAVMSALAELGGQATVSRVQERLAFSLRGLADTLDAAHRSGLVAEEGDSLRLTPRGEGLLVEVRKSGSAFITLSFDAEGRILREVSYLATQVCTTSSP